MRQLQNLLCLFHLEICEPLLDVDAVAGGTSLLFAVRRAGLFPLPVSPGSRVGTQPKKKKDSSTGAT